MIKIDHGRTARPKQITKQTHFYLVPVSGPTKGYVVFNIQYLVDILIQSAVFHFVLLTWYGRKTTIILSILAFFMKILLLTLWNQIQLKGKLTTVGICKKPIFMPIYILKFFRKFAAWTP